VADESRDREQTCKQGHRRFVERSLDLASDDSLAREIGDSSKYNYLVAHKSLAVYSGRGSERTSGLVARDPLP